VTPINSVASPKLRHSTRPPISNSTSALACTCTTPPRMVLPIKHRVKPHITVFSVRDTRPGNSRFGNSTRMSCWRRRVFTYVSCWDDMYCNLNRRHMSDDGRLRGGMKESAADGGFNRRSLKLGLFLGQRVHLTIHCFIVIELG
jgi:hypothetical protein